MIDMAGLRDMEPWPGNPDVRTWVFENGFYVPRTHINSHDDISDTCGDTLIMYGREEEFRRTVSGLEEYINKYPDLGDLEPAKTVDITE
jgi:hypothetical protein